jgi:protein-S-isoprenylcysteine O-methyltransferase Ste14
MCQTLESMEPEPMPVNLPDHSGVAFPPPFLYAIPLAAGLLLHWAHPIVLMPRGAAVPLGVLLVALGLALVGFAMGSFFRARTSPIPIKPTTAIVETGPYRFTRNPMYLGLAALYLGVTLWVDSLWPVLFLPVALFAVQRFVIAREELYLEAKFGEQYRGYKARVRRWL